MRASRAFPPGCVVLAVLGALALLAGCRTPTDDTVRVGVLVDCVGLFRGQQDPQLSGAELPLLERGATLRGETPSGGVTAPLVGGRRVELVPGCVEGGEVTTTIEEARRLIEDEHVVALVAGTWPADEIALRELARRHTGTVFVVATTGPREVTLHRPAANLVRLAPDYLQATSGLGMLAGRTHGWRRVHLVTEDSELGWAAAQAFAAQFCRPGRSLEVTALRWLEPRTTSAMMRTARRSDGTVVALDPAILPAGAAQALDALGPRHLLLGPWLVDSAAFLRALSPTLHGVLGVSLHPLSHPGIDAYLASYRTHFPAMPVRVATEDQVIGFRDGVEAVLEAVQLVPTGTAVTGVQLAEALRASPSGTVFGPTRVDEHGQGVADVRTVRVVALGPRPRVHVVAHTAVGQSLGGRLPDRLRPSSHLPSC